MYRTSIISFEIANTFNESSITKNNLFCSYTNLPISIYLATIIVRFLLSKLGFWHN